MAVCRDCKHYDIERFRMSNGRLRFVDKGARCNFDGMDRIQRKLPASYFGALNTTLSWMAPTNGNGCPQWTKRDPEK